VPAARSIVYPFAPKSTASLRPGQFWALPLSDGTFGAGRVIEVEPASRQSFLAGVLDWHGASPPTTDDIAGAACLAQGVAHTNSIVQAGGVLLGLRPLESDGIAPWLVRGAEYWRNSMVYRGMQPVRPQTPEDVVLPVRSSWGLSVAVVIAERRFVHH
jgi:hypothetical protein